MSKNVGYSEVFKKSSQCSKKTLTVILACFGDADRIADELKSTITELRMLENYISLVVAADGTSFLELPVMNEIKDGFSNLVIINMLKETHMPSKLINAALKYVESGFIAFSWAGSRFDSSILEFVRNPQYEYNAYSVKNRKLNKIDDNFHPALGYGWLQCKKLLELNNIIVSSEAVNQIGEFDESPLLQKHFDWEWMLRLHRYIEVKSLGSNHEDNSRLSLCEYPFKKTFEVEKDIIHRYVLRTRQIPYTTQSAGLSDIELAFFKDLAYNDVFKIYSVYDSDKKECVDTVLKSRAVEDRKCHKITIIGGYWEYHHNQLCFFNYLDMLQGIGFATYKVLLDELTCPDDVKTSDLVIITRSRTPRILKVIDSCKRDKITTLYMLDDNWLTIAKDLPEDYGQLFVPGNQYYDTFIKAIKTCDALITYNRFLYEDLLKYNKNVILFPTNINLAYYNLLYYSHYQKTYHIMNKQGKLIIGYIGSYRHDANAFKALANVARDNKNIKVLLFGVLGESQKRLFADLDTIMLDYTNYQIYCRRITEISPDILIAPLSKNRTFMSKCPNKYLETAAANAAGIYSDVYPYNGVVKHGINGLLVKENTVEAWENKLLTLINNTELRLKIRKNCRRHVRLYYSTSRHIKSFCSMISGLIARTNRRCEDDKGSPDIT